MANTDKTIKQLLTEPFRVQKKQGYYSFDAFRKGILSFFQMDTRLPKLTLSELSEGAKLFENSSPSSPDRVVYTSNEIIRFLAGDEKKICYMDESLLEMLSNTVMPEQYSINHFFAKSVLILLPKLSPISNCISILLINESSRIKVVPCFSCPDGTTDIRPYFHISIGIHLTTKEGQSFLAKTQIPEVLLVRFLYNFLLWQQMMHDKGQEVIELDAPTKQMGFGKNSKQLIVPRVIGEGYKPKVIRNYTPTGTHASPTTHWRSGHWRQQPYGNQQEPKYKTIWIEPTLVNPA
jgi:hypothetical protein